MRQKCAKMVLFYWEKRNVPKCVRNMSKMRGTPLGENTFWTILKSIQGVFPCFRRWCFPVWTHSSGAPDIGQKCPFVHKSVCSQVWESLLVILIEVFFLEIREKFLHFAGWEEGWFVRDTKIVNKYCVNKLAFLTFCVCLLFLIFQAFSQFVCVCLSGS